MMRVRCPACLTTFRIKEAHLHTRSGKVRCGRCYTPFNALENLISQNAAPEDNAVSAAREQKTATPAAPQPAPTKPRLDADNLFRFDEKLQQEAAQGNENDLLPRQQRQPPFDLSASRSPSRHKPASGAGGILSSPRLHAPISDFPSLTDNVAHHFALRAQKAGRDKEAAGGPAAASPQWRPRSEADFPPPPAQENEPSPSPQEEAAAGGRRERRKEIRLDLPPSVKNAITLSEQPERFRAAAGGDPRTARAPLQATPQPPQPSVFKHRTTAEAPVTEQTRHSAPPLTLSDWPEYVAPASEIADSEALLDEFDPLSVIANKGRMEPTLSLMEDDDENGSSGTLYADENPYYSPRPKASGLRRSAWGIIVGTLLGVLFVQGAYLFREDITRTWPQLRPAYLKICGYVGCTLPLPRTAGAISIETSDLESDPLQANRYVLNALLRNTAAYTLQYPYLELTLTDVRDRPLVRRALPPQEWLPNVRIEDGMAAGKEIALRLPFEAQGIDNAVGYRIYAFYP